MEHTRRLLAAALSVAFGATACTPPRTAARNEAPDASPSPSAQTGSSTHGGGGAGGTYFGGGPAGGAAGAALQNRSSRTEGEGARGGDSSAGDGGEAHGGFGGEGAGHGGG